MSNQGTHRQRSPLRNRLMSSVSQPSEYERLIGAALRFVSYRPRSVSEIRSFCERTLKRHHTTAPRVIDQVLSRLAELGYANDEAFAQWWISQRTTSTPKSARMIEAELLKKGVKTTLIGIDDRALALASAKKKYRSLSAYPEIVQRQKLISFLLRRGFSYEISSRVVDDLV